MGIHFLHSEAMSIQGTKVLLQNSSKYVTLP